ncbi:MAG: DUF1501 domain-containing protein, partial [Pirellulaceae bacterium]
MGIAKQWVDGQMGISSRRKWLQVGGIGLGGLSLGGLLERRARGEGLGKAKSVIVLFMSGGLPQHETFDPKPEAAEEIRGQFGAIQTKTPGLLVG